MSFISFVGIALLLTTQGKLFLDWLVPRVLPPHIVWALGFPIGAFVNVLVFFFLTVFSIPLYGWTIFPLHVAMTAAVFHFSHRRGQGTTSHPTIIPLALPCVAREVKLREENTINFQLSISNFQLRLPFKQIILTFLLLSLSVKFFSAFSHAVLLPSIYYDSLSQWNHRAKVSYRDRAIAFDADERRGVSKPQYPILTHALEIVFMLPQGEWKDRLSNASTFFLTMTSLLAIFLLFCSRAGPLFASFSLFVFLSIPLLAQHLSQGLADIHVLTYFLLSAILLFSYFERGERSLLLLSALLCAAAAWVKQEGLFFGVVPWLLLISAWIALHPDTNLQLKSGIAAKHRANPNQKLVTISGVLHAKPYEKRGEIVRFGMLPVILLGIPWSLLLLLKGLPLGAHPGDFSLSWHSEGVKPALEALFAFGSFGIFWYAVSLLTLGFLLTEKNDLKQYLPQLFIMGWGFLTFLETLVIFLFTPNVQFLLNNQSFHRTALIPLVLLVLDFLLITEGLLKDEECFSSGKKKLSS